eukprot:IDg7112t1
MAARSNVEIEGTGIEAHSSLSICERYDDPLRSTHRKMSIDYPTANKDLLLHLTVKAINDTLGLEGLVPSSLVFGELLRVYTRSEIPKPRGSLVKRAKMVHTARRDGSNHG